MKKQEYARLMAGLSPAGKEVLEEHLSDYGEILLHVLAEDLINEPLMELLRGNQRKSIIQEYCNVIETMWKTGDDGTVNVVDVTILERLSDDPELWGRFGQYLSDEFKQYINDEVIPGNIMMNCSRLS